MLEAKDLSKHFGDFVAVDGMSFAIEPGCVTGLLGPNGSGKTTILRMALGLVHPTSGSITIGGHPIVEVAYPYQRVGALLDASWVHPNRTAKAHLKWICQASRIPTSRVGWALEEVALTSVANETVGTFSLGMKQRLGLASTILGDPELLILDEPMNGLDPEGAEWIRGFVTRRAERGCAVLLASHLMREMQATAQRILVMGRGRMLFDGTLDDLRGGGESERFVEIECADPREAQRVLEAGMTDVAVRTAQVQVVDHEERGPVVRVADGDTGEIMATLKAAGIAVRRIEEGSVSLHEAYMQLTKGEDRRGETR